MTKDKLSKRQTAIYDFICAYTSEHGYPPSVREIGKAVSLASPSTVHMHLKVLEERDLIRRATAPELVSSRRWRSDGSVPFCPSILFRTFTYFLPTSRPGS